MPEQLSFSISQDEVFVLALLALAAVVLIFSRTKRARSKRKPGRVIWLNRRDTGMADPLNQMDAIHSVDFEVQKLLNSKEARLLPVLEATLKEIGKGHRVMAQTSMGEILRPKPRSGTWQQRKDAFASINSKRLDFAIFDRYGRLVCAIEFQGSGHHQGKAFMRDAVKREVVRKAGVAWIKVKSGDKPSQLRADVRRALGIAPDQSATSNDLSSARPN